MTGHDPPCNDCRHYGRSVRDVVDTASWEILNDTHGIRETDCCRVHDKKVRLLPYGGIERALTGRFLGVGGLRPCPRHS